MSPRRISPGCANCRSRRIQCNLMRPRCSQCARASLRCTGYRSKADVLFRDQTRSTVQKCSQTDPGLDQGETIVLNTALSPDMDDLAKKLFFDYFPLVGYACKHTMELKMKQPCSATTGAISVGLVTLAAIQRDHGIMQLARQKYNDSLKQLVKATRQPWEAPIENSIAASYFLSIFEMFSNHGNPNPYSWINHVHGSAAFLHSSFSTKGRDFTDPMKEALEISFTKLFACLISHQPVPHFLAELTGQYEKLPHLSHHQARLLPAARLFPILSDLVNLYLENEHILLISDTVVRSALISDLALQDWANSALETHDPLQQASTIPRRPCAIKIWNYYRLGRIIANTLAVRGLDSLASVDLSSQCEQYLESYSIISSMQDDLFADLPSMLSLSVRPPSQIYFSADVYFAIIILQSLSQTTGRETVIRKLHGLWNDNGPFEETLIQYV